MNRNQTHRQSKPHQRRNGRVAAISRTSISVECAGLLETHPKGYGFLRESGRGYARDETDTFVSQALINRHGLRQGCQIMGKACGGRLSEITVINGIPAFEHTNGKPFHELTPASPTRWMRLEQADGPLTMRILDLLSPIGFGQRALIAAPPRAGKTTLLQQIGQSISVNHPDAKLLALLVDERPEEITDMVDELPAEIFASSLDNAVANHARLSSIAIDRCKRLVEHGHDVVLLVDSLTRMTRAFNKLPGQSRMMGPGGLRVDALEVPRTLFASARAFKEFSGSLTIIATVLVGTDNRMDEVIFREFKGTGNTDLVLDQELADMSIWPALELRQSATRRSEKLQDVATHAAATALRRSLLTMPKVEALQGLNTKLQRFDSNDQFVALINESIETPTRRI